MTLDFMIAKRNKMTIKALLFITLTLTLVILSLIFFPTSPTQMTIIDEQQQTYFAACPTLTDVKSTSPSTALNATFSLLNWNIYKQQKIQWSQKLTEWAQQADLITLQEAKLTQGFIQVSKEQQLHYLQNYAFEHDGFIFGVNTLSRVPAKQVCGSRAAEPWIMVSKTGLASTYAIQGIKQTLLLINLHGINFTFTAEPLKQQTAPYLALIRAHQGPIIVAGDFNTWSDARTKEIVQSLISAGFDEIQFTNDQRMTVLGLPLDHVFYRDLIVTQSQSFTTTASDHNPLLISFSLLPK